MTTGLASSASMRQQIRALVSGADVAMREIAIEPGSRPLRLLTVYKMRLLLLLEDRFADVAKIITAFVENQSMDGRTMFLVAKVMEDHGGDVPSVSYAKLVSRVYREAIKRTVGGDVATMTGIFYDLVSYSASKCSNFQADRDVDDFIAFFKRVSHHSQQEAPAKLAAALWNEAVSERARAAVGGAASTSTERARALRSMARKLAPLAPAYNAYFQNIFDESEE